MGYSCLLKINSLAIYNVVFIIKSQWTILQKILLCKFLFRFLGLFGWTEFGPFLGRPTLLSTQNWACSVPGSFMSCLVSLEEAALLVCVLNS